MMAEAAMPGMHESALRDDLVNPEPIEGMGSFSALALVHDLRNPIAAVYAGAELLARADLSPDQSRRVALSIHRASAHADRLLKSLVKACRGEGESHRLWNLTDLLSDVCEAIAPAAQSQMVHLEV